jgi:hypothetical protein
METLRNPVEILGKTYWNPQGIRGKHRTTMMMMMMMVVVVVMVMKAAVTMMMAISA